MLRPRIDELEVGPLRLELVEPMQRQRLVVADNDSGVAFDVTLDGSAPPFFESPDIHYRRGRLLNHVLRYTQLGRADGSLTVDGRTIDVRRWYACRDHSWGIRASMGPHIALRGVEPTRGDPRAIRIWLPFEVEHDGDPASRQVGMFSLHEDSDGKRLDFDGVLYEGGEELAIVDAEHRFVYTSGAGAWSAASSRSRPRPGPGTSTSSRPSATRSPRRGTVTSADGATASRPAAGAANRTSKPTASASMTPRSSPAPTMSSPVAASESPSTPRSFHTPIGVPAWHRSSTPSTGPTGRTASSSPAARRSNGRLVGFACVRVP